ncbi:GntR family transcriptional regulator [Neorhizobium sp. BT27B]|uniref:GntR family transcriptional regulator n=1 Tax=Neorhizobium sp. BT27B TaxID=3142625 RepID=UPI003D2AEF3C
MTVDSKTCCGQSVVHLASKALENASRGGFFADDAKVDVFRHALKQAVGATERGPTAKRQSEPIDLDVVDRCQGLNDKPVLLDQRGGWKPKIFLHFIGYDDPYEELIMSAARANPNVLEVRIEKENIRSQVVRAIRRAIISGEFLPGPRLVESDLCAALEVSRPSLREALRHLESEHLVTSYPTEAASSLNSLGMTLCRFTRHGL